MQSKRTCARLDFKLLGTVNQNAISCKQLVY